MWWLMLMFTLMASPVLAVSYTVEFLNPSMESAGVSPDIGAPGAITDVSWGNANAGSRQSSLRVAGGVNVPPLNPNVAEPIAHVSFRNGQIVDGTGINAITLRITDDSGQSVDARLLIDNTPNIEPLNIEENMRRSADFIGLTNPGGFCRDVSGVCTEDGLTRDLRAFEDNPAAAQAGLYAKDGSISLIGFAQVIGGFSTGSLNREDITALEVVPNVLNSIDQNGIVSAVPEPSTGLLMAGGLFILVWRVRSKALSMGRATER